MSATNQTTYYELPIFIGTDVPSWLGDWNNAMNAIDTAIQGVSSKADSAKSTADSAASGVSNTNENVTALTAEVKTIKEAVQNYDQILDFSPVNTALVTNNLRANYGGCYLVQNTNKTINRLYLMCKFNKTITQLISYTYTDVDSSGVWVDCFTAEDNCFKLTQGSQPTYLNALTVGPGMWIRQPPNITDDNETLPRLFRAWYDGATTHFGITFNSPDAALKVLQDSYFCIVAPVLLSGSVYNPPSGDSEEE